MAEQAFTKMARLCKVGESMEDFKRCLSNSLEPWLLILDNADDPFLDISRFFPVGNRGTIIVTSRNLECRCHATVGSRELREMGSDEAVTLLLRSGDLSSEDEDARALALPIVQNLGSLALAVNHAGASIRQRVCSLGNYLGTYTRHRKKLLSSRPVQSGSYYEYTVYTTWEISVDSIKELAKNATHGTATNALEFLTLFGFCHFDDITEDMFESAWSHFAHTKNYPWLASNLLSMIRDRRPSEWDSFGFNEAIQLLSNYSLIHVSGPNSRISLHPLVHSWIRDSLSEELYLRWWHITVSTLALARNLDLYHLQRQLRVHLRHCIGVGQLDDLFPENDVPVDRVNIVSWTITVYSDYPWKDALMLAERALEYSRKSLGDECYSTLLISRQLAYIFNRMSEFQKSSDLLQDKIDVSIRVAGPTDNLTLNIMTVLGWAYRCLGRKQEALELAERTLAVCEESLDEGDRRYLRALEDLALVYRDSGRNEEAVDLSKKLLAMRKEKFNEESVHVLDSEHRLATAYSVSGQHQAALELFQSTLKKHSKVFREDHPDTVHTMVEIATAYGYLGQPEKGIPLIVKALEVGSSTGLDEPFRERGEEIFQWLESESAQQQHQSANTSSTVPERLAKSEKLPHRDVEDFSSKQRRRLWPKGRRQIGESSS